MARVTKFLLVQASQVAAAAVTGMETGRLSSLSRPASFAPVILQSLPPSHSIASFTQEVMRVRKPRFNLWRGQAAKFAANLATALATLFAGFFQQSALALTKRARSSRLLSGLLAG